MKHILFALALSCGAVPAFAAAPDLLGKHDADLPVVIEADKNIDDTKAHTVLFTGNVHITQGEIQMRAESVRQDSPNNKIYVNGKVVVDSPTSGTVTGDNGIYDLTRKVVTLSGHVVVHKQGQVTMSGSLMTVNMVTGITEVVATPVAGTANQVAAPGAPGGRVRAVVIPKSAQTGGP